MRSPTSSRSARPGVDRPLTEPRHWRRSVGRLVKVDLVNGSSVTGRVEAADADGVDLDVAGHDRRLAFAEVRLAKVEVEFNRPGRLTSTTPTDDTDDRQRRRGGLTWTST